ncbi:MAG: TIGR03087 family PEP-CTERM/XrtA system glycosyltransferase, partial [Pirellulales bacterium]|nr:TIGR03087 family PEP-CTERM/XrtA system glycosyltransferase [Pirellulales bacterium]
MDSQRNFPYSTASLVSQRPKILYLVHPVPYPPNRGDRIRSYRWLEYLSTRGSVYLGTLADEPVDDDTRCELNRLCEEVEVITVGLDRWRRAALALARGHTATEGLFSSRKLLRRVEEWCANVQFDQIVVFCSSMFQYLDTPRLSQTPTVVDLVDVDSKKWFEYAEKARWPKSELYQLEGRRLRKLESTIPSRADSIAVVTAPERKLFEQFSCADSVHVIPNGVDTDYYQDVARAPYNDDNSQRCVFVGALDYGANIDGVEWFCHHVWSTVSKQFPKATFSIVGRNPARRVRQLTEMRGVEVFGDVPDVRPYFSNALFSVAPLRIARGMQNKVLESLAMSRTVILSPKALDGIHSDARHHVRVAETAD